MSEKNVYISEKLYEELTTRLGGNHEFFRNAIKLPNGGKGWKIKKKKVYSIKSALPDALFENLLNSHAPESDSEISSGMSSANPIIENNSSTDLQQPNENNIPPETDYAASKADEPQEKTSGEKKLIGIKKHTILKTDGSKAEIPEEGIVPQEQNNPSVSKQKAVKETENKTSQNLPKVLPSNEDKTLPAPLQKIWYPAAFSLPGKSHLKVSPPIPCQDDAYAAVLPSPVIIVCDGSGSSKLSHIGANKVIENLSLLAASLQPVSSLLLDVKVPGPLTEIDYVTMWIKHANETLKRLAEQLCHPVSEFRCTLLLTLVGREKTFWLQIGDGYILLEKSGKITPACRPAKGEYANETSFLGGTLNSSQINFGFEDSHAITGAVAMTDGASERLVKTDGSQVAARLQSMLDSLRNGTFSSQDIFSFLSDEKVWNGTSGDDKGMAMIAR